MLIKGLRSSRSGFRQSRLTNRIIRVCRSVAQTDYFYMPSSMSVLSVGRSVCLSVGNECILLKTAEAIEMHVGR